MVVNDLMITSIRRPLEGEKMGWGGRRDASPMAQLSFQVGLRLSKKALSPSIASLVFIKRSR